ncbi:MAG TPA: class I SAM-dependent methyltransferase [Actinomycetota bacterium]|nr:class I SAM-dependent methyltransferase [Actinomycetota bacterium]
MPSYSPVPDEHACLSCGSTDVEVFHQEAGVPVNSCLLLASEAEARAFPRGAIRLGFCHACGFIGNTAFDQALAEYSTRYEETQGFSPRFQRFADDLAHRLVDRFDLRDRDILEIGCGKGEFLLRVCELGGNRGIGVDPSVVLERVRGPAADRVSFIADLYRKQHADLPADFVICRHTLEHISDVAGFMELLRANLAGRQATTVFFELPDVLRVLREVAFWDIYYEHCSYFTVGSLVRLFERSGFAVLDASLDYDDQYILLEARTDEGYGGRSASPPGVDQVEDVAVAVREFRRRHQAQLAAWDARLADLFASGRRAVVWGAGSKGVAFLCALPAAERIEVAVDINPYKHGMFMAATGQRIVPPEFLAEYRPDVVIVMNPIYRDEIRAELDRLRVDADVVAV